MAGRLRFRVLGPLEIERDGSVLQLRGAKLRGLLALLLLRAGELVTLDALIDALWGEQPPATARTALQMQVSRLRKLLSEDPSVSLLTQGPGYVLQIDPERLDKDRFEALVEKGRAYSAGGEVERAREELGRALELWRGEPLGDIDIPGLPHGELSRLSELHRSVIGTRIEADLALGRHLEVIPELEALLQSSPLDERLCALSAIASYRAGRQNDALEILARLRRSLSEELGIAPGLEIANLERQILAADPALDPPAAEAAEAREARKTITALVCRFSPAGQDTSDPEADRAALAPLLEQARGVLERLEGSVRESLGQRLVVLFGTPRVHEDDARRAVAAAEELRRSAAGDTEEDANGFRAGISTGEVLVRSSGSVEELLSSGPLEEAEQLLRAAKPGEILLDQAAAQLVGGVAGLESTELLLLGEGSPARVAYRLSGAALPRESLRRLRSPLVGRREELALLAQSLARVRRENKAAMVSLIGPAGVGKSRLVSEFLASTKARVLVGRCLSYGRDITYWPITEILRQACGITEQDSPEEARAKIGRMLEGAEEAKFIGEQVAAILGLSDVGPVPDEIFWAIRKFLEALGAEGPLVVVLDDLHWAEERLLDLIEHLVTWTREAPILLVCMARGELEEFRPGWGGGRLDAANLVLGSLSASESSQLIDNLLGPAELPEEVRARLAAAAEGHPLYIEELLAMLIAEGGLIWRDGRWVGGKKLSEVPIPPTVQALLGARVDRTSAGERRLLEKASVIGKEFSEEDLEAFEEVGREASGLLDSLVAKDLILPEPRLRARARAFRFRHVLLRDVVYKQMPKQTRARAHAAYAEYLERRAGDRISELDEIVGYHYESALSYMGELGIADTGENPFSPRAARRLASAGHRAFIRDDMAASASLHSRALALLDAEDERRAELCWEAGVALFEMGKLSEAEAVIDEGLVIAERAGNEAMTWRLRIERTELRSWRDPKAPSTHEIGQLAKDAVDALKRLGDRSGVARAYRLMGDALSAGGHVEEATECFEKAVVHALEAGDEREATQRPNLGVVQGPLPADRCIEIIRRSLKRMRRPNPDAMAGLGLVLAMTGELEEARRIFQDGLDRARDLGEEWKEASINMYLGAALLIAGDESGAESALRPTVEALQRMGERGMMSTAVALLAEALYRQGKNDEAMLATLVSEEATAPDDLASQIAWRGVRAKVLAVRGELREAERLAREGVAHADRADFLNQAGDAHMDLAVVVEAAGKPEEAAAEIEQAVGLYERKGNVVSAGRARKMLASVFEASPSAGRQSPVSTSRTRDG